MFSVIIPLYNKADTIERAICSVLAQTEQNFELIVVDDGSKDDGPERVRAFCDPRILLIQQPNGGVSAARNTGINAAKYEYITFLDADDEYLPDFLKTIEDLIQDFPQAGIWGTNYWNVYPDGSKKLPIIRGLDSDFRGVIPDYFAIAAKSAPVYWTGAVCIRKTILQEIGGFPVGIKSGEDLLTWARICAKYPAGYIAISQASYHLEGVTSFIPKRIPQSPDYVGQDLIKLYMETNNKSLRHYIALWLKNRVSSFFRLNMKKRCFNDLKLALYYEPENYKYWIYFLLLLLPYRTSSLIWQKWMKLQ